MGVRRGTVGPIPPGQLFLHPGGPLEDPPPPQNGRWTGACRGAGRVLRAQPGSGVHVGGGKLWWDSVPRVPMTVASS